jgi:hypothetical protein
VLEAVELRRDRRPLVAVMLGQSSWTGLSFYLAIEDLPIFAVYVDLLPSGHDLFEQQVGVRVNRVLFQGGFN